jgi:hypothetical protein
MVSDVACVATALQHAAGCQVTQVQYKPQATLTADKHPRFEKDLSNVEQPGVVNSVWRE